MSKKETDRHVDPPQVSFTLLVDIPDMNAVSFIAKQQDRTRGYIVREAIRLYLEGRNGK